MNKTTLVLGASTNSARYSNMAILALLEKGHRVVAIGSKKGKVQEVEIQTDFPNTEDIHTVTLYLNPANQEHYMDAILKLHPERIIFNPGTENPRFAAKATALGISCENACTLVLLNTNQY